MTRWNRRLLLGVMALLVPALAGCEAGFNAPTLAYHPAANGATKMARGISINNAFVLGPALHSELPPGGQAGFFLAISSDNGDRLVQVTAPGTASSVQITGGSVDLPQNASVTLTGPQPELVLTGLTSPLRGGQTIQMKLIFAHAGTVTMSVPVMPHAYDYATYAPPSIPAVTPSPAASGTATPSGTASASPSATP